jgi:hypothetical protein
VVLGGADGQHRLPVAEDEERRLLAGQAFLDDDAALASGENLIERGQRLLHRRGHRHALAGREPVRLDHDRCA